jgi:heterodisulfide reductase subunit A2
MNEVILEIDGREVRASEGMTILEAARSDAIDIPTLCYHRALTPYGGCRLCTVELVGKGKSRMVTSCVYPVAEGLVVTTRGDAVVRDRRMIIELMLAQAPKAKVLQDLAQEYGVTETRFEVQDHEDLCILCGLCARVCEERVGASAINFVGRGVKRRVQTPFQLTSDVDFDVCLACGSCASVCPTGAIKLEDITGKNPVPLLSEFEMGLGSRSPAYIPFPQAVPKVAVLDRERCLHFFTGQCKICQEFCEPGAIDFSQEDEIVELEVGAVIVACGFDLFDVSALSEYGYGRIKNVITAMEFERLTAASGPTMGELRRPSDGRIPGNVAFIQCVGSRDINNKAYCSAVCCMHATKEAILASEHHPGTKSTIFYMDMRAVGKRYQEYVARARTEYDVTYIRGRPGEIMVDRETGNPIIWYTDTATGETKTCETELVVLCQALASSSGVAELADLLDIRLDADGFVSTPEKPFRPVDTTRHGVFVCGCAHSPRDIPDSVIQASAAAARAAEVLTDS